MVGALAMPMVWGLLMPLALSVQAGVAGTEEAKTAGTEEARTTGTEAVGPTGTEEAKTTGTGAAGTGTDAGTGTEGRSYPVVDLHVDLLYRLSQKGIEELDAGTLKTTPSQLRAGGYVLQVFAIFVPPKSSQPFQKALKQCSLYHKVMELTGVVDWPPKGRESRPQGDPLGVEGPKQGVGPPLMGILALEGVHVLESDPGKLDPLVEQGLRIVGLTWNGPNAFGTGVGGKAKVASGLTPLGRQLLRRMESLGLILDLAHADETTFWDAITEFDGPVMVSHSAAKAINNHDRNLDDEQLLALAEKHGIIGMVYHSLFLRGRGRAANVSEWIAHIRYVYSLFGISILALGSDFDGGITPIVGVDSAKQVQRLFDPLEKSGFSVTQVLAIAGGNALEFLAQAQEAPKGFKRLTWRPLAVFGREVKGSSAAAFDRLSTTGVRLCAAKRGAAPALAFRFKGASMTALAFRSRGTQGCGPVRVHLSTSLDGVSRALASADCQTEGGRCLIRVALGLPANPEQTVTVTPVGLEPGQCLTVLDIVPIHGESAPSSN